MKGTSLLIKVIAALMLAISTPLIANASDHEHEQINVDPWEGFNRAMFSFNETIDTYALKPVAKGYKAVTPDIVETGVGNFFGNLSDVGSMLNNVLQFKGQAAAEDMMRVLINSTVGLAGLIDVATPIGLPEHNEDFGQTLGHWGVGTGPYLVLPFFGPSNVRDGVGLVADSAVDPVGDVDPIRTRNQLYALRIIDDRARLLAAENLINGDRYTAIRDAYLQRREFMVNDGQVDADFDDEAF